MAMKLSKKEMYTSHADMMTQILRDNSSNLTNWLVSSRDPPISCTGCDMLISRGKVDPAGISQPVVSAILPEEAAMTLPNAFAMITYEFMDCGIYREPITPQCLPELISLLVKTHDECLMIGTPDLHDRSEEAFEAIRMIRNLFCRYHVARNIMVIADEDLRSFAPTGFRYVMSLVYQSLKHNSVPELMGLYKPFDMDRMTRFEEVHGIEMEVENGNDYSMEVINQMLCWTSFMYLEIKAMSSMD